MQSLHPDGAPLFCFYAPVKGINAIVEEIVAFNDEWITEPIKEQPIEVYAHRENEHVLLVFPKGIATTLYIELIEYLTSASIFQEAVCKGWILGSSYLTASTNHEVSRSIGLSMVNANKNKPTFHEEEKYSPFKDEAPTIENGRPISLTIYHGTIPELHAHSITDIHIGFYGEGYCLITPEKGYFPCPHRLVDFELQQTLFLQQGTVIEQKNHQWPITDKLTLLFILIFIAVLVGAFYLSDYLKDI